MRSSKERAEVFADKVKHEEYYDSNNKVQVFFNRMRIEHIVRICGDMTHVRVLDVGVGDGFMAQQFHARELWGIDISSTRCERARKRLPEAHIVEGDAQALAFSDNFFDVVVCADALEHMERPDNAIDEMMRVVKVGGSVVVSVPNETAFILARILTLQGQLTNPDHIHRILLSFLVKHFKKRPSESFNIPNLPYPLCVWQCYIFVKEDRV